MKKTSIVIFISTLLCASQVFAQLKINKDMTLVPDSRITNLRDEPTSLQPEDFINAALIATGISKNKLPEYKNKVEQIYADYEEYRTTKNTKLNDAEAAIVFLYDKKILKTYHQDQTYMDVLLDDGIFNCVSSAILYMYILKRRGFKVIANETPDHVFCTVMDEKGKQINVETTSAYGYAPGIAKNVNMSSSGKHGSVSAEQNTYEEVKRISGRRLISNIYNNRIGYEQRKENPDCELLLQLTIDSTELQVDTKEALQDMYFCVGNVMYYLFQNNRYEEALYISKAINEMYGRYGKSQYLKERTDTAFLKVYEKDPENLEFFENLVFDYSEYLTKDTYDKVYEAYIYEKVIQLTWDGEIEQAKQLLMKGLKVLNFDSPMLSELETQLEDANY